MTKHFYYRKPPSPRQLKVGETIRQVLSTELMRGDLYDDNNCAIQATIAEVAVSPDLKNATVFVIPFGKTNESGLIDALAQNASQLRHLLGKKMALRHLPVLQFVADTTIDYAHKINTLLKEKAPPHGET